MKPIKTPTFILPTLLKLGSLALIAVTVLAYGWWQARFLIAGPSISIGESPAIVQNERTVVISGTTENATKLYLNGRPIITDPSGNFTENVVLENGASHVSVDAYDRYGRLDHWEQSLVFVESQNLVHR